MQAALLAAKEGCDEACCDPFAPGAEETQVTRAQLFAAARQVRAVHECPCGKVAAAPATLLASLA